MCQTGLVVPGSILVLILLFCVPKQVMVEMNFPGQAENLSLVVQPSRTWVSARNTFHFLVVKKRIASLLFADDVALLASPN